MVFLEGLPGVGKTTIIDHIKEKNLKNVHIVDEIVTDVIQGQTQRKWIENDIKKISMYDEGLIIIDRGPLSTLSYNETLKIINTNDELDEVYDFFNNCISLYEESIVYYLQLI